MYNSTRQKNPWIAAGLSVVPGLGQLYVGRPKKGLALLCIDLSLIITMIFFYSRVALILSIFIYLASAFPSGIEAYFIAKTGSENAKLNPKAYVIVMLLFTGFGALPLLWQDTRFSKSAKIIWTVAVTVLAVLFFTWLAAWGTRLEKLLHAF